MTRPTTQAEFVSLLKTERANFEIILDQVGETRMTTSKAIGDWSIKDVVAHIIGYEQFILDRILELKRGETYLGSETQEALAAFQEKFGYPDFGSPLLDDDGPNAWIVDKYRSLALEDVRRQELQVYTNILREVETLSDEQLINDNLYQWIASNTYNHFQDHTKDIQNWLDQINKEVDSVPLFP